MRRLLLLFVISTQLWICQAQGDIFGNLFGGLNQMLGGAGGGGGGRQQQQQPQQQNQQMQGGLGSLMGGLNQWMQPQQQGQPQGGGGGVGGIMGAVGGITQWATNTLNSLTHGGDVLNDLKGLTSQPSDWSQRASALCQRYPGHPNCQGGQTPQFNQLGSMLDGILREGGKFLPRVPFLNIRDPLSGLNLDLVNLARGISAQLGAVTQMVTNSLLGVCRNRNCHQQTQENINYKSRLMKGLYQFEKQQTGRDNTAQLNLRADRTQQIKQALLEKANLGQAVTAADNGVFDKDILLTDDQQTYMLNSLGKGGVGSSATPPRVGRAGIFFYENPVKHWDMPVPYTFDSSLEEYDKNDIRGAIQEIEQKTCIRFKYVANAQGHHINYQKVDSPTFCGLSYVGRADPANPVYLSFQCGNARGVALHETMHALGVAHQHLRPDRDQHITIDWSNVNPQTYDMFAVVDAKMYTSYGVKYDYGSIMHYNAYTGAVNIGKPTMIPKVDSNKNIGVLGQRAAMSASDIEILNKMYCWNDCVDINVYCGAWALQNLCGKNQWVSNNCRKSCSYCRGAGK